MRFVGLILYNPKPQLTIQQVFSLPHVRSAHLNHNNTTELFEVLVKSYGAYGGNDYMAFVKKTGVSHIAETKLQKLGVKMVLLSELTSNVLRSRDVSQAQSLSKADAENLPPIETITKIQRFWRSQYPKLLERRSFMKTPTGRMYALFLEMCEEIRASTSIRRLLTGKGVELYENIRSMTSKALEVRQRAIGLLIPLPQGKFQNVDEVIEQTSDIEHSLEKIAKGVALNRLEKLAVEEPTEMQLLFRIADSELGVVASDLRKATERMQNVSRARQDVTLDISAA